MGDATDLLMDESSFEWKKEEMFEFACAFFDRVVLEWREEIILDKEVIDRVLRDDRIDELLLDAPEQHRRMWAVMAYRFGLRDGVRHDREGTAAEFGLSCDCVGWLEQYFVDMYSYYRCVTICRSGPLKNYMDD